MIAVTVLCLASCADNKENIPAAAGMLYKRFLLYLAEPDLHID